MHATMYPMSRPNTPRNTPAVHHRLDCGSTPAEARVSQVKKAENAAMKIGTT
jgi:hypothetical protein